MTEIKKELKLIFPDAEFDNHESDLYVRYTRCIWKYLDREYMWFDSCSTFISEVDGERWIEIPFANWD